jgi:hypothetical protein
MKFEAIMNWTFAFLTPGHAPLSHELAFGSASHGMAAPNTWLDPQVASVLEWPPGLVDSAQEILELWFGRV